MRRATSSCRAAWGATARSPSRERFAWCIYNAQGQCVRLAAVVIESLWFKLGLSGGGGDSDTNGDDYEPGC